MSIHIESYPLIKHLEKETEFFTAGVFVCIINLDLLPQYLLDYLDSPDSFNLDPDTLNYYLDQLRVWIIKEKKEKPDEFGSMAFDLVTPPQETRKRDESLKETLAASLVEECLPIDQMLRSNFQTTFFYCEGVSYLGHATYKRPPRNGNLVNKYRADCFLVACSGTSQSNQLHDPEVEPVGWITIGDYLSDMYPPRRLGGKTVVQQARMNLLRFLETYWENPAAHQLSIRDAINGIDKRKLLADFKK